MCAAARGVINWQTMGLYNNIRKRCILSPFRELKRAADAEMARCGC